MSKPMIIFTCEDVTIDGETWQGTAETNDAFKALSEEDKKIHLRNAMWYFEDNYRYLLDVEEELDEYGDIE